jgi:hypothetical protein
LSVSSGSGGPARMRRPLLLACSGLQYPRHGCQLRDGSSPLGGPESGGLGRGHRRGPGFAADSEMTQSTLRACGMSALVAFGLAAGCGKTSSLGGPTGTAADAASQGRGDLGFACRYGDDCGPGLACDWVASSGTCGPCGGDAQLCCGRASNMGPEDRQFCNAGLACAGGGVDSARYCMSGTPAPDASGADGGRAGAACQAGDDCGPGLKCRWGVSGSGTCQACGAANQVCCGPDHLAGANDTEFCNADLICNPAVDVARVCVPVPDAGGPTDGALLDQRPG